MKRGQAPYLPVETFERVLQAQRGKNALRNRTILTLAHYTGMRAIELANLKVGDVADSQGVREVVRLFKTKGDKPREIPLNNRVRSALADYLKVRPNRPGAPLFLSQKGGGFSPNTLQRCIAHLYARAEVKASSHSGRRSFATRLIETGADIRMVQILLGHSSITTTQTYIATSPERLKRAVGLL